MLFKGFFITLIGEYKNYGNNKLNIKNINATKTNENRSK